MSADAAFCHICAKAEEEGKLKANSKNSAFLRRGFSNWKDVTEGFHHYEQSKCHQDAVQVMIVLRKSTHDVGELLSSTHLQNKVESQRVLLKILRM